MVPAGPRRDSQRQRQKLRFIHEEMRGATSASSNGKCTLPCPGTWADAQHRVRTSSSTLRTLRRDRQRRLQRLRERYAGGDGCRIFLPDDTLASLLASFYRIDDRARIERMRSEEPLEAGRAARRTQARPCGRRFPIAPAIIRSPSNALDLLSSNLDEDLALEDAALCAGMGLSPRSSSASLAAPMELSPMAYRHQCRVERRASAAGSREASPASRRA